MLRDIGPTPPAYSKTAPRQPLPRPSEAGGPGPAPRLGVDRTAAHDPRTRHQALGQIAEVLAASEPHSPTPMVLREVAQMGADVAAQLQARLNDAGSDISVLLQVLGLGEDP